MNLSGKKVLIVGVNGFIGTKLMEAALRSSADVVGLDNFSYSDRSHIERRKKDITLVAGDVSDYASFKGIGDVDLIFHFGAPSSIVLFNKTLERCYRETVLGQLNVFRFAREMGVGKVVYPSTGSLYGGNQKPHSEGVYPKPLNSYGAAKLACEGIASCYSPFVKSTGLRIFAGYGPGEERKNEFASVVCLFLRDMMNGKPPIIFGDGKQTRDFVFIDDVAKAILKAADASAPIINVGTGIPTSFLDIIEEVNGILDRPVEPVFVKKDAAYVENLAADTRLMKEQLGVETIPLRDGIARFAEHLGSVK